MALGGVLIGRLIANEHANAIPTAPTVGDNELIAVMASGMSLIFGLMDVINFAHGVCFAWGAYVAFSVFNHFDKLVTADSLLANVAVFMMAVVAALIVVGIVGIITAFNFPVAVWSWNALLAAVCGDVMIWKPSSQVPLCAIAIQNIVDRVVKEQGLPKELTPFIVGFAGYGNVSRGAQEIFDILPHEVV